MNTKTIWSLCAMILAAAMAGHTAPAHAGNVYAAQLSCFVDTYAFDYPQADTCTGVWTPGGADNPSIAFFQVDGLSPGNYSFQWVNLETGAAVGCSSAWCSLPIATETLGDGYAALAVTITDLSTGAQKTVGASANYLDGWH